MAWSDLLQMSATIAQDRTEGAARVVRHTVQAMKREGLKIPHAMEEAARALATSPRRIRSLYFGEPVAQIRDTEYSGLVGNFLRYLDKEAESLRVRAATLENQRAELERHLCASGLPRCENGGPVSGSAPQSVTQTAVSNALAKVAEKQAAYDAARARRLGK